MLKDKILSLLTENHELHLAEGIDALSAHELETFLHELRLARAPLPKPVDVPDLEPLSACPRPTSSDFDHGQELLSEGKVGCITLAGGRGSRLGSDLPKALTPVTRIRKKTLLQLLLERQRAAHNLYGKKPPLALMASPLNFAALSSHAPELDFFCQQMLALIDEQGKRFVYAPGKLAFGPNGNGYFALEFVESGLFDKWSAAGVEYVNITIIDNPLADPFDAALVGRVSKQKADVGMKCILRTSKEERVGVVGQYENRCRVVEYSELHERLRDLTCFPYANTGLYCFTMEFIKRAASLHLPYHAVRKRAYDRSVYTSEAFIFDLLALSRKTTPLLYAREDTFAPLKSLTGEGSLHAVQEALLFKDRKIYEEIAHLRAEETVFELDPQFYYPTKALREKWAYRSLPSNSYLS